MTKANSGNGGLKLPSLGIGCWSFGGGAYWGEQSQDDAEAVVRRALELGCNYFDTAELYNDGDSETSLGQALKGRRQDALIGSKISPPACYPREIRKHCEASLKRLGTDYLDLYMIHWPLYASAIKFFTDDQSKINNPPDLNEAMAALAQLHEEGKVRHVGVSNFGVKQLTEALEAGVPIAVNQLPYSLLCRALDFELLPLCREHDIQVIAYLPLMQGLLTGKYKSADEMPVMRTRTRQFRGDRPHSRHGGPGFESEVFQVVRDVESLSLRLEVPMHTLALAYCIATPGISCTIVGARSEAQLDDLARVLDFSLPEGVKEELDQISEDLKLKMGPLVDLYQSEENTRTF